jgi:hypothetical protein
MEQLILHLFGDYITQSHWMAVNKTKTSLVAWTHALIYSFPFLLLTRHAPNPILAGNTILLTHFLIDRFRLARYVIWIKNFADPTLSNPSWEECEATGYPPDVPTFLAVWLMLIADNTLHLAINYAALRWL